MDAPKRGAASKPAETVFGEIGKRLAAHPTLRRGLIAYRLTGRGAGDFLVDCSKGGRVEKAYRPDRQPTVEIMGDAARIQAIFEGKKDPLKQFVAGGIRVRGDLPYLSEMLLELGLIEEAL